jgi:hypothetical protein
VARLPARSAATRQSAIVLRRGLVREEVLYVPSEASASITDEVLSESMTPRVIDSQSSISQMSTKQTTEPLLVARLGESAAKRGERLDAELTVKPTSYSCIRKKWSPSSTGAWCSCGRSGHGLGSAIYYTKLEDE